MEKLAEVVKAVLNSEPPEARDRAAAGLALTYATQIDEGGDLSKLGPALLAALESLLLSPRARTAAKKAVTSDKPAANPLDQLAERRRARSAPAVDATAAGSR